MKLGMGEEFATLDFNSKRLEKRFMKTMETLSGQPDKSIFLASETRAECSETKFPQQYTECLVMMDWIEKRFCEHIGKQLLRV
jgi:hypothetical protein